MNDDELGFLEDLVDAHGIDGIFRALSTIAKSKAEEAGLMGQHENQEIWMEVAHDLISGFEEESQPPTIPV